MAKKWQFKRSMVPGKVPTIDDLKIGEIAINLVDQVIYTKRINPEDGVTEEIIPIGGMGGDGASVYEILLSSSDFAQETFSVFDSSQLDVVVEETGSFNGIGRYFVFDTNKYFISDNIVTDGNSYSIFQIFVNTAEDPANYKIEYSIDGGDSWVEADEPYRVMLDDATSDFRIKFTSLADGVAVYGFGVLYDLSGMQGTSTTAFVVKYVADSDLAAGTIIELPEGAVYNPDGKSLEVYLNGVLQYINEFYTEEDSTHIKILKDIYQDGEILFRQYYGYVFIDEDHIANVLNLQWSYRDIDSNYIMNNGPYSAVNGDYIFADTSVVSDSVFIINLYNNPVNGDTLFINDVKGTFDINYCVVYPGDGDTIMGGSDIALDIANKEYKFIYNGLRKDWRVI